MFLLIWLPSHITMYLFIHVSCCKGYEMKLNCKRKRTNFKRCVYFFFFVRNIMSRLSFSNRMLFENRTIIWFCLCVGNWKASLEIIKAITKQHFPLIYMYICAEMCVYMFAQCNSIQYENTKFSATIDWIDITGHFYTFNLYTVYTVSWTGHTAEKLGLFVNC